MKKIVYTKLCIIGILLMIGLFVHGQKGVTAFDEKEILKEAIENYNNENFHIAQQQFKSIMENSNLYKSNDIENAAYHYASCALELFHADAIFYVNEFINMYHSSGKIDQLEFESGRYFYRKKDFDGAIPWFNKVDPKNIDKGDIGEYYFASGYSYFMLDSIEQARLKFFEIKDGNNEYSASALYYYSHIHYDQGNYQTAIEGFEKLRNDSTFASIAPYYISQILFLQEKYKEVIKFAPSFLEQVTEKRKGEVARFIAESYFNLKEYAEAIPYYVIYTESGSDLTEEDYYQSGYSLYRVDEYEKAAEVFEKISNNNSALGQNASYHLADCYIKLENKQKALIAFTNAARTDFDPRVTEDALFNKAVLSYELSLSPFSESIKDFELYIEKYPNSARIDEAYNYLTMAYLNTRNYEYAYSSLQKIKTPNDDVKRAYQHVAFFRGIELFTNQNYTDAVEKFNTALQYSKYDKNLNAKTLYWKGESLYRLGKYVEAINVFEDYVISTGAFLNKEYYTAHYNLGYCYFKTGKYSNAQVWFRKFIGFEGNKNKMMLADAYNRSGDIAYLKDDYQGAIKFYSGAASLNLIDADYALMQKAMVYGLQGEYQRKINTLQELLKNHPTSSYNDDALYESATSFQALNNLDNAESYLNSLISKHSGSSYEKSALLRLGLIYYNRDEFNKAIATYKKVVASYPGTDEAKSALVGLKNIYVEQSNVENYLSYVDELGGEVKISRSQKDSLLFTNAENIYFNKDYENAVVKLKQYISEFPESPFVKRAYVYLAECYNHQGRKNDAREAYQQALKLPGIEFNEQSLLELSRINYSLENYDEALNNYNSLFKSAQNDDNKMEASLGKMRCEFKLKKFNEARLSAENVLSYKKLENEFEKEARYIIATTYFEQNEFNEALPYYRELAENLKTVEGAEAKYKLAEINFKKGKIDEAENVVYDFIKQNSPHQYWVASSYLLLARVYIKKDDFFQAKHTVQSILDYYDNDDDGVIASAHKLKEEILEHELKDGEKSGNELEIDLESK